MNAAFFEQLNPKQQSFLRLLATKDEDDDTRLSTLAREIGFADESGLRYHLAILEANALIKWPYVGKGNAKILRLTNKGREMLEANPSGMTYFEGGIHAGAVGVQYEPNARIITKLDELYSTWQGTYLVRVVGHCMVGGKRPICEGDRVEMRPLRRGERPRDGQVVHVELPVCGGCAGDGDHEIILREYSFDVSSNEAVLTCYNPQPGEEAIQRFAPNDVLIRGVLKSITHDVEDEEDET